MTKSNSTKKAMDQKQVTNFIKEINKDVVSTSLATYKATKHTFNACKRAYVAYCVETESDTSGLSILNQCNAAKVRADLVKLSAFSYAIIDDENSVSLIKKYSVKAVALAANSYNACSLLAPANNALVIAELAKRNKLKALKRCLKAIERAEKNVAELVALVDSKNAILAGLKKSEKKAAELVNAELATLTTDIKSANERIEAATLLHKLAATDCKK